MHYPIRWLMPLKLYNFRAVSALLLKETQVVEGVGCLLENCSNCPNRLASIAKKKFLPFLFACFVLTPIDPHKSYLQKK